MTGDDFRDLALGMQGAVERAHMNHPDFRANGRIFATLNTDESAGVVMLSPEEQRELLREQPGTFSPVNGAWGRQGATSVALADAEVAAARGAMLLAWQGVMQKPRRRTPRASTGSPRRGPRAEAE